MNIQRSFWLMAVLTVCFGTAMADENSKAAKRKREIDTTAQTTLDKLLKEDASAKDLYGKAVGYAVFTVTKPAGAAATYVKLGLNNDTDPATADAVLAMYHDQGLPVLKYASFGAGVNITLGLPIIRTSVDHGTALDIAGTGKADAGSLIEAVKLAIVLANSRA